MTTGLSVSRLVNVTVNLTPPLAAFPNFSTCLVLGTSNVIDVHERMREYNGIDEVAADFGTNCEEYFAALAWFSQSPQPENILIGRWANAATHGLLVGAPISAANQAIGVWNAINNGAFNILIDGVGPTLVGNLDFSAQANLNGVANIITTGFPGGSVVVTWDAENERFVATSQSTGAGSTMSFATAPGAGTDISGLLGWLSTSSGAYEANGVAAQSALATVALFDDQFGSRFYGLFIPSASDGDILAVAPYIEADALAHFFGVNTMEGGVIVAGDTGDIAYLLKQLNLNRTLTQYSSTSNYAVMSALARILTTNWQGNNTTITLMYKLEPIIVAETLTAAQMDALLAKNCNVFVNYNNNTAIIQPGACASGQFADTVIGCDWFRAQVQTNLYNALYGTPTKIPQTDEGMGELAAAITNACVAAVNNGLVAPGTWNAGGFGQLQQGDFLSNGYYVYQPPISQQDEATRMARKSVPFQVAIKLGGAVHEADVGVLVNP